MVGMDIPDEAVEAAAEAMEAAAANKPDTQQIGTLPAEYQPRVHFSPNRADIFYTNPRRSQP